MMLVSGTVAAVRASRNMPPKRVMPNLENIESCVRLWLDNYKVSVKNDPSPENHFRLRITLDAGHVITVLRSKTEYPEYVQILTDLGIRGENKKLIDQFSAQEKTQILLDIKIELARAKIGYAGLVDPPEYFHLFRRIPIHPNLTEHAFMSTVGELEAATNLVLMVFLKAQHAANQNQITQPTVAPQLNASNVDIPMVESILPEAAVVHREVDIHGVIEQLHFLKPTMEDSYNYSALIKLRVTNRGLTEAAIVDWKLYSAVGEDERECALAVLPHGVIKRIEYVGYLGQPKETFESVSKDLKQITFETPLKKGVPKDGWIMFKIPTFNQEMTINARLILVLQDALGETHHIVREPAHYQADGEFIATPLRLPSATF
jgi:hypothetical protein